MGVVFFNVPEARKQLLEHGVVYSLRMKRFEGETTAVRGSMFKHESLARVKVELCERNPCDKCLRWHVGESGFASVEAWLKTALEHYREHKIKSKSELGLYKVTVLHYIGGPPLRSN